MAPKSRPTVLSGDDTGLLKLVSFSGTEVAGKAESRFGTQGTSLAVDRLSVVGVRDVAIATRGGAIRRWDGITIEEVVANLGTSRIKGLQATSDRVITCLASGKVEIREWSSGNLLGGFNTGDNAECAKLDATGTRLAVGGKDHELKVWDVTKCEAVFKARNVPNDSLDVAVPIWITDAVWTGENTMFTCTAYNQIRAYDFRQRRPIRDCSLQLKGDNQNKHLNCILALENQQAIVGDTFGRISLVDVFNNGRLLSTFKGPKASVRSIAIDEESRTLACGGLDRYVRIFDLDSHKQVGRCYVKQKVNQVAFGAVPAPENEESDDDEGLDWGDDSNIEEGSDVEEGSNDDDQGDDSENHDSVDSDDDDESDQPKPVAKRSRKH